MRVSKLGTLIDSWSTLIDGQGPEISDFEAKFLEDVQVRQPPFHASEQSRIGSVERGRPYLILRGERGFAVTAAIRANGNDLYLRRDVWLKPAPNWNTWSVIILLALVSAFITSREFFMLFIGVSIPLFLVFFGTAMLVLTSITGMIGLLFFRNWNALLVAKVDLAAVEDVDSISQAIEHAFIMTANKLGIELELSPKFQSSQNLIDRVV